MDGNISSNELGSTSLGNVLNSLADFDGLASLGESREDGCLALEKSGERGLSRVDEDCDERRKGSELSRDGLEPKKKGLTLKTRLNAVGSSERSSRLGAGEDEIEGSLSFRIRGGFSLI